MATSRTSEDQLRFCRLCILVFGKARDVVADELKRAFVQQYGSGKLLEDILNEINVQKILRNLRPQIFMACHRDLLYPQHRTTGGSLPLGPASTTISYSDLDITLITMLIRNLSLVKASAKVWDRPEPTNTSLAACIARIRITRNTLGHSTSGSYSTTEFQNMWTRVVDDLVRISNLYSRQELDDIQQKPIENISERVHAILDLIEQCCKGQKHYLTKLDLKLANIAQNIFSKLDVILEKVTEISLKQQEAKHEILLQMKHDTQAVLQAVSPDSITAGEAAALDDKRHSAENIPEMNPTFSGRKTILEAINSKLCNCQRTTLTGLGGIGKSQTALEFAYIHRKSYNFIRWVDADRLSLRHSLLQFARDLNIPTADRPIEDVVKRIYKSLQDVPKWLLIFDNAEDHKTIKAFLPLTSSLQSNQHLLITSQDQQWDNDPIFIDVYNDDEALEFCKRYFQNSNDSFLDCSFRHLAQMFGNLPIAVNHACAFINQTPGMTIDEYLQMLEKYGIDILNVDLGGTEKHVVKTFLATINKLKEIDPNSVRIICQCALIAPDNIPVKLFNGGDQLVTSISLRLLKKYSVITTDVKRHVFRIHRILQKVLMHLIINDPDNLLCISDESSSVHLFDNILQSLLNNFSANCPGKITSATDVDTLRLILPHLSALCEILGTRGNVFKTFIKNNYCVWVKAEESALCLYFNALKEMEYPEAAKIGDKLLSLLKERDVKTRTPQTYASLLTKIGHIKYYVQRDDKKACELFQEAIEIFESTNGKGHISVAEPMRRLGNTLRYLGKTSAAAELFKTAMIIYEEQSETNCDGFADTLTHFGVIFEHDEEHYEQALDYFKKSLEIKKILYGESSIQSVLSLQHIGIVLKNMGQYEESIKHHSTAIEITEQTFGSNHIQVSHLLEGIGSVLSAQDKYSEALPYHRKALEVRENAFGKEHPYYARSLAVIGNVLEKQGKHDDALHYHKKALELRENVNGKDHQICAYSLHDIGSVLEEQGKYEDALQYHKKGLELRENTPGKHHPELADSLDNLGSVLEKQCKYDEALAVQQRALIIREQENGKNHPKYAESVCTIGNVLYFQKHHVQAVQHYKTALGIYEAFGWKDHVLCATVLHNLGTVLLELDGGEEQAYGYLRRALKIRTTAYGENHAECGDSLNSIGVCQGRAGEKTEAGEMYQRALKVYKRIGLGENHSQMKRTRENLAKLQ